MNKELSESNLTNSPDSNGHSSSNSTPTTVSDAIVFVGPFFWMSMYQVILLPLLHPFTVTSS